MSDNTIHAFDTSTTQKITGTDVGASKRGLDTFILNASDVGISTNTVATITNETLLLANTEYSFALPANCKGFVFKPKTIVRLSLAYTSGGPFFDCGLGSGFIDNNKYASQSIYLKSNIANTIIDLITYT